MHTIVYDPTTISYDKASKTFSMSEKDAPPFATSYDFKNPNTGKVKRFEFKEMTGSEWDPKTKSIYKHEDITLEICNDPQITETRAKMYLNAKTRS